MKMFQPFQVIELKMISKISDLRLAKCHQGRMKDKYEVLVSSDTSGALGVWDPSTGNCLHQYKGGLTRANTLTWIKQVSRNFSFRS